MDLVTDMKKWTLIISTTLLVVPSLLFCWTFFSRMKMDYNSEGNYFDINNGLEIDKSKMFGDRKQ
jgi:hypothetical protein